ncbi:MAG TPA: hypothetical protein VFA70_14135 [Dehalococcoidia bacterium]|nr:hypothetical protein [Dehalococcoidia bacterium]
MSCSPKRRLCRAGVVVGILNLAVLALLGVRSGSDARAAGYLDPSQLAAAAITAADVQNEYSVSAQSAAVGSNVVPGTESYLFSAASGFLAQYSETLAPAAPDVHGVLQVTITLIAFRSAADAGNYLAAAAASLPPAAAPAIGDTTPLLSTGTPTSSGLSTTQLLAQAGNVDLYVAAQTSSPTSSSDVAVQLGTAQAAKLQRLEAAPAPSNVSATAPALTPGATASPQPTPIPYQQTDEDPPVPAL